MWGWEALPALILVENVNVSNFFLRLSILPPARAALRRARIPARVASFSPTQFGARFCIRSRTDCNFYVLAHTLDGSRGTRVRALADFSGEILLRVIDAREWVGAPAPVLALGNRLP